MKLPLKINHFAEKAEGPKSLRASFNAKEFAECIPTMVFPTTPIHLLAKDYAETENNDYNVQCI